MTRRDLAGATLDVLSHYRRVSIDASKWGAVEEFQTDLFQDFGDRRLVDFDELLKES